MLLSFTRRLRFFPSFYLFSFFCFLPIRGNHSIYRPFARVLVDISDINFFFFSIFTNTYTPFTQTWNDMLTIVRQRELISWCFFCFVFKPLFPISSSRCFKGVKYVCGEITTLFIPTGFDRAGINYRFAASFAPSYLFFFGGCSSYHKFSTKNPSFYDSTRWRVCRISHSASRKLYLSMDLREQFFISAVLPGEAYSSSTFQ